MYIIGYNIIGLYRPPPSKSHATTINQFTDEFLENLQEDIINGDHLKILGDFNIHIDDNTDADAQSFADCTSAMGLEQHVDTFTHNQGHTLDHIYTLIGAQPILKGCRPCFFLSDHRLIAVCTSIQRNDIERRSVTSRCFKNFNLEEFKIYLQFSYTEDNTLEELIQEYQTVSEQCMDKHAPKVTKRFTKRKQELWYNERIIEQKRLVRRRERMWLKYAEDHQWIAYTTERNRLNRMIHANKRETLCKKVEECSKDSKKLYSLVNNMCGTTKQNPLPEATSEMELAESFADYFLSKIVNIRDALDECERYHPTGECEGQLTSFRAVTEEEVKKAIICLPTKSCELDEIPTKHLKQILDRCLGIITMIMNSSLKQGQFASSWKTAVVRPLLKKAGLELVNSNYRPVSNLNFLSKVLEKLVLTQFNKHCVNYVLYPEYQSAYRQFYSCETALLKLMDDILWNMEHQKVTAMVCLDLSTAFDTVDHIILLDVLHVKFGLSGKVLEWFASYLNPRDFMVNVGDSYSSKKSLTFSVPQGSCAGPTLYSAYASTMREIIPGNMQIHGYADDHTIKTSYRSGVTSEESLALAELEETMVNIRNWKNANRLKMNDSKTEFIVFGSQRQITKLNTSSIKVNDTNVEASNSVKYLGVHLDANVNLKKHVTSKCKIASLNLFRIRAIRKYLTQEACASLVLGLIVVHLDYANGLFIGLPNVDIKKLQRVQTMAAKLVLGRVRTDSGTQCLKELHWLPIKLRVEYKILTTVYKCLNNQAPTYLKSMLKRQTHVRTTRTLQDPNLLVIPTTHRKTFADRSFSVAGPKLWNELPNHLRSIPSFYDFKKQLKTFLFNKF